ncbi:MAG: hypothetical protein Q9190_000743 [Brigantiaea leucoxantha]
MFSLILCLTLFVASVRPRPSQPVDIDFHHSNIFYNFSLPIALSNEAQCNPGGGVFSRRTLWTQRCMRVIRQLPPDHHEGHFHVREPDDNFRLPKIEHNEECTVRIELLGGRHEVRGSWTGVKGAATELVFACSLKGDIKLTRGGKTKTAEGEGVLVTIFGTQWRAVGETDGYDQQ